MSPEAQRIAIAEACGWIECRLATCYPNIESGIPPKGVFSNQSRAWIPNYLNDLNAMNGAEKVLTEAQLVCWAANIEAIVENDIWQSRGKPSRGLDCQLCENTGDPNGSANYGHLASLLRATAGQRAEAFLRTIGKWDDTSSTKATP